MASEDADAKGGAAAQTDTDAREEAAAQASDLVSARAAKRRSDELNEPDFEQLDVPAGGYPNNLAEYVKRNALYIASVAAVALIVAVIVVMAGVVMTGCSSDQSSQEKLGYQSPFNWSSIDRSNGRFSYVVDGQVKSRLGVDVSENQRAIDWDAVAADGIDFAMIRVGYRGATAGDMYLDAYYWANLAGARAAGLDCGVYFFSQAQTIDEAVEEADFVLKRLNGTSLEYPIVFDSEEKILNLTQSRTTGLGKDQMTAIARAFCDRVQQAGYEAMIYGNQSDIAHYNYDDLAAYPIWWAEYDAFAPAHNLDIAMWQYTNAGEVAGIPTSVDLSIDLRGAL